jgi:hypothetical protein
MRMGRWVSPLVGLALLVSAGLVRAEEARRVYATSDECWEQEHVSCGKTDAGWVPAIMGDPGKVTGEKEVYDEENLARQRMSMEIDTSGTLEHPVVAVDMNRVIFPDVQPYLDLEVGRVRVPVRFVAEQMGAAVAWDNDSQVVTITRDNLLIKLKVDDPKVEVNGKVITIDAPPRLLPPGRVMVPLRFVSEAFGANVDWVGAESPHPSGRGWGKYQVWIWVDWGYWGKHNIETRFQNQWWFMRREAKPE